MIASQPDTNSIIIRAAAPICSTEASGMSATTFSTMLRDSLVQANNQREGAKLGEHAVSKLLLFLIGHIVHPFAG